MIKSPNNYHIESTWNKQHLPGCVVIIEEL